MATASTASPTPEASPYSRHLPALDGLRGIAVLLVMGSHLFPGTPHNLPEHMISDALAFGATGVDLFFVLSGFLITGILYDSLRERQFFRKFYARRALRILPLYYGVLAVYAIAGAVQHRSSNGELLSLALYMQNTSVIAPPIFFYSGALRLPLGHFWSLAIEEQFYLVWPLVVFLVRRRRALLGVCALFMVVCPVLRVLAWAHGMAPIAVHSNTLCRADSLLIGGALAFLLRGEYHDQALRRVRWLCLLLLGIPLLWFGQRFATGADRAGVIRVLASANYSLLAFGYAGVLALSLAAGKAQTIFKLKPLRVLGKYSYGLYVLHLILLAYLEDPLRELLRPYFGKGAVVALVGAAGFVVSFAAAYLSYQMYERRFLRLKRFFDYRPHGTPEAAPPSTPLVIG